MAEIHSANVKTHTKRTIVVNADAALRVVVSPDTFHLETGPDTKAFLDQASAEGLRDALQEALDFNETVVDGESPLDE